MFGDTPNTLDGAAAALHEMYLAYLRAGFDRTQAFELVKAQVEAASESALSQLRQADES